MKMNQFESHKKDRNMGLLGREYRLLGRLPEWNRQHGTGELRKVKQMNKFLDWQEARIERALSEGNNDKAFKIWMCLLKGSWSYQLLLFHRCKKGWYRLDQGRIRRELQEAINDLRKWDFEILVNRFYIPKKNGKFRPIGSPNLVSKMVGKALADMMIAAGGNAVTQQHGFTPGKGIHTAIMDIWEKYHEGLTDIYEFDLKGWFNKVRPAWVIKKLAEFSGFLANQTASIFYHSRVNLKEELKPETELVLLAENNGLKMIGKQGMTQGMPYSPVAANLALEAVQNKPKGLVMYADDGVILQKGKKLPDWLDSIGQVGAELALEKSGWTNGQFRFLGVDIDFNKKIISFGESQFHWRENTSKVRDQLFEWLKRVPNKYGPKKDEGWSWDINENSYIATLRNELSWTLTIKIICYSLWKAEPYKGYRYFIGGGIQDVISSSSRCLEKITKDRALFRLTTIKSGFEIYETMQLTKFRKDYVECTSIKYSPAGTDKQIEDHLWKTMESYSLPYKPY